MDVSSERTILRRIRENGGKSREDNFWDLLWDDLKAFTCSADGEFDTTNRKSSSSFLPNLTWKGSPALGRVPTSLSLEGFVRIKCCKCGGGFKKIAAKINANFDYEIHDSFKDAHDFNNNEPGNQEYNGGTPFEITGGWHIYRSQKINPECCP